VREEGRTYVKTKSATTVEQLVSETDHVQLTRLVTEQAWRADQGRANRIHELYVDDGELIVGPTPLRGREPILAWGRQIVENPPWRSISRSLLTNAQWIGAVPRCPNIESLAFIGAVQQALTTANHA